MVSIVEQLVIDSENSNDEDDLDSETDSCDDKGTIVDEDNERYKF